MPVPSPTTVLPYGTDDLDAAIQVGADRTVRCYVRGCTEQLKTPRRGFRGDVCPVHQIRCHYSAARATYAYVRPENNIIASRDLFRERIVGHPFKYESHRLGLEKSEDALSWNVFRSLQEAGGLAAFAERVTGEPSDVEPFLYLWGIGVDDDQFAPWNLLIEARNRFESKLPVERPLTEPDIALHLPGKYLILIEAKFTSGNTYYTAGPRKNNSSLTLDELLAIYHDPTLEILDLQAARSAARVHYQLWRNTIFADWMAQRDHPNTKGFHVNLVRDGQEVQSAGEFQQLVRPNYRERFRRLTWEDIYRQAKSAQRAVTLLRYLETKTAGLVKAFRLL